MKSFRITAPFLTDDERREAATGYDGPPADTTALLGVWDPASRKIPVADLMVAGLQAKPMYAGTTDPTVKSLRRKRNKAARQARRKAR